MAQTTGAAVKALIESLGLSLTAYRDDAPAGTTRPYCTIVEEITLTPDPLEDAAPSTAVETCQVDLWQDWKVLKGSTSGQILENYSLAPALRKGIHGKRLQLIGTSIVYMARVTHSIRLFEPDENLVHHAITVEVNREL